MDSYVIRPETTQKLRPISELHSMRAVSTLDQARALIAKPLRGRTSPTVADIRFEREFEELMIATKKPRSQWLNEEQTVAVLLALAGYSLCIMGPAGVGKSVVANCIVESLTNRDSNHAVFVCAPTGVAAYNIGGQTLHSAFGLHTDGSYNTTMQRSQLMNVMPDTVVFDEMSMISPQNFVSCHLALKQALAKRWKNMGRNHVSYMPFCNTQVIACGDFWQLSPVQNIEKRKGGDSSQENARASLMIDGGKDRYIDDVLQNNPRFVFETILWRETMRCVVSLHRIIRQSDAKLCNFLMCYRYGRASAPDFYWLERNCLVDSPRDNVTTLYPKNNQADERNKLCLSRLAGPHFEYSALTRHSPDFDASRYDIKRFSKQASVTLAVGAEVILTRNLDTRQGYTNGSRGRVVAFVPIVQLRSCVRGASAAAPELHEPQPPVSVPVLSIAPERISILSNGSISAEWNENRTGVIVTHERAHDSLWGRNPLAGVSSAFNSLSGTLPVVRFYHDDPSDVLDSECRKVFVVVPSEWVFSQCNSQYKFVPCTSHIQVPLLLGWAQSIHSSQGMTLTQADIVLDNIFAAGQAYTALTRVKSVAGLRIIKRPPPSNPNDEYKPVQWFSGSDDTNDMRDRVEKFEIALFGANYRYYNMSPAHYR